MESDKLIEAMARQMAQYEYGDGSVEPFEPFIGIATAALKALRDTLEPVAVRYDYDGYGWRYLDSGSGSDWLTRAADSEPLYALPEVKP